MASTVLQAIDFGHNNVHDNNGATVDREYFGVTKVTWAKCSMSFNRVNLAGLQNLFLDILLHEVFLHYMCMYSNQNGRMCDGILCICLPCL